MMKNPIQGTKLSRVLIANRGAIARRIIRTLHKLDLGAVAVYSEADADSLHVREADNAVLLGAAPVAESYLRVEKILAAAKEQGAQAIHPGYGFLSENADFAEACEQAGLIFVGPTPKTGYSPMTRRQSRQRSTRLSADASRSSSPTNVVA